MLIITNEGIWVKQATKSGYILCEWGGVFDISYPDSLTRRGRVQDDGLVSPTVMANHSDIMVADNEMKRIRRLTEKECWRLMGFDDESYERAEKVTVRTNLYKQAGNSICVNVLEAIFGQMIEGKENEYKERWG